MAEETLAFYALTGVALTQFTVGSMGPKVEAGCRFIERTGQAAAIGALQDALAIVKSYARTKIVATKSGA